ncbi:MAG: DsbA family protein [Desulfuromonadales bacterium]|nr:DsbA family protein [Desulfuromonadales bacterium]MBN2791865.1 DsbA family protein [Desulfuromonadales bacterium]
MRIEQLRREFDLDIRWTVFPLHPETGDDGRELADLFSGRMDVPRAMAELQALAQELGLPFGVRIHTYNSRLAQELGKWAELQGRGDNFRAAVYHAYFADGRNIAHKDVLLDLCQNLDLPLSEARKVLAERLFSSAVDDDWQRAGLFGVRSVPTHIYRQQMLVGFQDYAAFKKLVSSG